MDWDDVTEPRFAFLPKRAGAALERAVRTAPPQPAPLRASAPRVLGLPVAKPLPVATDPTQERHLRRVQAAGMMSRTTGRARRRSAR